MVTARDLVARVLREDSSSLRAGIARAIPDAEPRRHLYDLLTAYLARPRKGFRASLCLASCRAFGGTTEDALDAAVALELLHSAFLIHDDIEDGSTLRRNEPSLHRICGIPLALNAGDGLCALALSALARCAARQRSDVAGRLLAEMAHLFRRSVEGQALELGWIADHRPDVTETEYLRMVLGKTCWYSTIHPCRLGALIGSKGSAKLDALVPFGFYVGAAFQIRDDLDNLAPGDGYDKNAGCDILEGKRTLPLLHLLARASPSQRDAILRALDPQSTQEPAERIGSVLRMMVNAGSLQYTRDVADSLTHLATEQLPKAFANASKPDEVAYIYALTLYLCGAMPDLQVHATQDRNP